MRLRYSRDTTRQRLKANIYQISALPAARALVSHAYNRGRKLKLRRKLDKMTSYPAHTINRNAKGLRAQHVCLRSVRQIKKQGERYRTHGAILKSAQARRIQISLAS